MSSTAANLLSPNIFYLFSGMPCGSAIPTPAQAKRDQVIKEKASQIQERWSDGFGLSSKVLEDLKVKLTSFQTQTFQSERDAERWFSKLTSDLEILELFGELACRVRAFGSNSERINLKDLYSQLWQDLEQGATTLLAGSVGSLRASKVFSDLHKRFRDFVEDYRTCRKVKLVGLTQNLFAIHSYASPLIRNLEERGGWDRTRLTRSQHEFALAQEPTLEKCDVEKPRAPKEPSLIQGQYVVCELEAFSNWERLSKLSERLFALEEEPELNFFRSEYQSCLSRNQELYRHLKEAKENAPFPIELLKKAHLMIDRLTVKILAQRRLAELQTYGALRFSRRDTRYPLCNSYYVLREDEGLHVLQYVHREDSWNKGRIDQHGSEAALFPLLDESSGETYLRRVVYGVDGQAAGVAASQLRGVEGLLVGAAVPSRWSQKKGRSVEEVVIRKMDQDLDALEIAGFFERQPERVRHFLQKIAEATARLHAKNWIHRDIKPRNTLASLVSAKGMPEEYDIQMIDFGYSMRVEEDTIVLSQGSPCWIAPELVFWNHVRGIEAAKKLDVFSLGAMGWLLLTNELIDMRRIANQALHEQKPIGPRHYEAIGLPSKDDAKILFGELGALLCQMMDPFPENRPSAEKAAELLAQLKNV